MFDKLRALNGLAKHALLPHVTRMVTDPDDELIQRNKRLKRWLFEKRAWVRKNVPPGVRSVIGVLFLIGGVLGFLPVLGFWMIPLGVLFISLDIGPIYRRIAKLFGGEGGELFDLGPEDTDTDAQ